MPVAEKKHHTGRIITNELPLPGPMLTSVLGSRPGLCGILASGIGAGGGLLYVVVGRYDQLDCLMTLLCRTHFVPGQLFSASLTLFL